MPSVIWRDGEEPAGMGMGYSPDQLDQWVGRHWLEWHPPVGGWGAS